MLKILQKLIPRTYWNLLRHLKNHPDMVMKVRMYIQTHGMASTIKRIQEGIGASRQSVQQLNIEPIEKIDDDNFIVEQTAESTKLKIAIVVHAFHLEKVAPLLRKISLIPYPYKLFITVAHEQKDDLLRIVGQHELDAEVIPCQNEGYDIVPFLAVLPSLLEQEYDLVCKLHTKKGAAHLEQHIIGIEDTWFNLLLDPLLGSEATIKKIIYAFDNEESLGMLSPADLYKSAQKLMYGNEVQVGQLLMALGANIDPAQDWNFVAGSMFWARLSIFEPLINNPKLADLLHSGKNMQTGAEVSIFHGMERVFGLLPQISHMRNGICYAIDLPRTVHAVEIVQNNQVIYNYLGVGTTLENEHHITKNYQILQNSPEFDPVYYVEHTPTAAKLSMNPLLHFLRYGVYQNSPPNANFSPLAYLSINRDVFNQRLNPLIHYQTSGKDETAQASLPAEISTTIAIITIGNSNLFDAPYYLKENPDISGCTSQAINHYCDAGWQEDRRPSLKFDSLWYQNEYLDHFITPVNPLLHYILVGKEKGFHKRPPILKQLKWTHESLPTSPQRVCLFAAYDPDGLVDDSVLGFVKELSLHADVYFLSDTRLQPGELDKLRPYTKGAWGVRHGEYDFGSYRRLAQYYIGWTKLETYDEVLLVNDSSYLLKPLHDLFSKMNKKDCCWWGAQATKGMSATKHIKSNQFDRPIPITTIQQDMLLAFEQDDIYDFHIGSYFLAFRRQIIKDGELKKLLGNVKKEKTKKNIILKYEFGLTRRLINQGYAFSTFVDDLYPFHPLYTNTIFDMIKNDGFPLFKRFFLTENHYHVVDLWRWQEKVLELVPEIEITPIVDNLHRISNAEKLHHNLHIQQKPEQLLSYGAFVKQDKKQQAQENYWVFPVCAYDHTLSGNERAVFEEVKDNPAITKIILTRSKHIKLAGINVSIAPLQSLEGQHHLLKADVIFIKHTPKENTPFPLDPKRHKFINLWHGIPLKRIGTAALDLRSKLDIISKEHNKCHCVIASSSIDRMAMASAFHPLTYNDIWTTGLPRNDFILQHQNELPEDFQSQTKKLETFIGDRKFILFAPTFRKAQGDAYFHFSYNNKTALFAYLKKHNIVLGIREHMADKSHSYSDELKNSAVINVGGTLFPNIEVLYRKADLLITDYSSCFIDFMLTGKPMISFAYDYEHYKSQERGLFYDLGFVFPGPICQDFHSLFLAIKRYMGKSSGPISESYLFKRKIFFDYIDHANAKRLVARVLESDKNDGDIV